MHSEGFTKPPRAMNRRNFLKLSGAGLAGAALLTTVGAGGVSAQSSSSLEAEFEEAAKKYRVPKELLLAMGYVNTRWEMPPPEASAYESGASHGRGAYGIMQLVQNPSSDTLGEASKLTGISEETLKTDRRSNILGGAALLAESQGERPDTLGDYFGAVAGKEGNGKSYEAVVGVGAGELYAEQIFETLKQGAQASTLDGEQISLREQSLTAWVTDLLDEVL